jgi:hypothetical protein
MRRRQYSVNDDFFSSPTPLNSYWAGFIAADGCVHEDKYSKWLEISIDYKDIDHVARFCEDVEYNGPIARYDHIVRVVIYSKQIVNDLERHFNITQRKSLTLRRPHLSDINSLAYIIGYIDGDGCIYIKDNKYLGLNVVGTTDVLEFMIERFKTMTTWPTHCRQSSIRPATNCKTNITKQYAIVGDHCKTILSKLNAMDVPKMSRKWRHVSSK